MSYKQNNPLSRKSSQGHNDRLDESLAKDGKESSKKQSLRDRRDESKGMEKSKGKGAYSSDPGMSRRSSSPLNNAGNIYGGWKYSRDLMDMPLTKDMTSRDESPVNFMGINPEHKGYCTPMTKSTCTPHRKALARRLKPGGDLYRGKKKK